MEIHDFLDSKEMRNFLAIRGLTHVGGTVFTVELELRGNGRHCNWPPFPLRKPPTAPMVYAGIADPNFRGGCVSNALPHIPTRF